MIPGNATITVVRRALVADRYGDDQPTGESTTHEVRGCAVAPRSSQDLTAPGRQGVLIGLSVYAPLSADVVAGDQIIYDGDLFDIDGAIGKWRSAYGSRLEGLEFAVRRALG